MNVPYTPTVEEIKERRADAELTQAEAAEMVYVSPRTWRAWETGQNPMPAGLYELWVRKLQERA